MFSGTISFTKTSSQAYTVTAHHKDGHLSFAGKVKRKWFRHIEMHGWEATGIDGHRGVHKFRWQAAGALVWDGKGYPFPVVKRYRVEVSY